MILASLQSAGTWALYFVEKGGRSGLKGAIMRPIKTPTLRPRHVAYFKGVATTSKPEEPEEALPIDRFRCSARRVHMVSKYRSGMELGGGARCSTVCKQLSLRWGALAKGDSHVTRKGAQFLHLPWRTKAVI